MESALTILVSLEIEGQEAIDVRLPVYWPIEQLINAMQTHLLPKLDWVLPGKIWLQAYVPGETKPRQLPAGTTLAEMGVWNGSHVRLIRKDE